MRSAQAPVMSPSPQVAPPKAEGGRTVRLRAMTVNDLRAALSEAQPKQADEARAIARVFDACAGHEPVEGWVVCRGNGLGSESESGVGIIAAIGYREILPGVAEAWAVFTRGCTRRDLVVIGREMAGLLAIVLTETGQRVWPWRRVQTLVRTREHAWHRWLERLGFRREGVLREYSMTGEDMVILAVTRRRVCSGRAGGRTPQDAARMTGFARGASAPAQPEDRKDSHGT